MSKTTKAVAALSATEAMQTIEVQRRDLRGHDVEFEVLYCGICHSDLHSIKNDWGNAIYPLVPGHEILGRVTSVGSDVTKFAVGDLVGVGCIVGSCQHCEHCHEGEEQFCVEGVTFSFNSPDPVPGGGPTTYGGFSQSYVCEDKYVVRMPHFDNLAAAAPLLCAGITVYSPLRHWGITEGKRVGILGIGGLGHVAIRIAKAMGAEVYVLTSSPEKVEDAKRLGADSAILTSDKEQLRACPRLDLIIDTASGKHDVNRYLNLLRKDGTLVIVGLPNEPLEVAAHALVRGRHSFSGSNIGGIAETEEMLQFCYEHGITADIELLPASRANEAMERLERGDVKYRFVLDMQTL
ncbi:MAG: NAD(P)-dependent alcohol dehydrogenase [Porphyromonas sp.]|nr:NAD(P)-dependent alcohol dehydrogenase [Porphyromonas sp.]